MNAPRDPIARALDAAPAAPPPPPVARVWEAVRLDATRRARRRLVLAVAAGLCVAIGAGAWFAADRGGSGGPAAVVVGLGRAAAPEAFVLRRAGAGAVPWDGVVAPWDDLEAREAATLDLAAGATLALEAGARVVVASGARAVQAAGRVRYDVRHDPSRPFTVVAADVEIVDVGTRFVVDVAPAEPAAAPGSPSGSGRVLVTVEEGEVRVGGAQGPSRRLGAGRGLALVGGVPTGEDWSVDARPVLHLDVETPNPRAGEPVVCRVTLRNPTDAWLPLPASGAGGPVWVEVTGSDGVRVPIRVTDAMRLPPRTPTVIPPRGEAVVRVQFERTFASPGAYRLRAVYRPADAVEPPRSPEALLTVR
ncbi:MAG: FecR domain-containing protein [Planctomycetota bacterium]